MIDYEKLGLFYIGKEMDAAGSPMRQPILYDSRDLTTHAVIVGMTGSGKTGLGITLLEEAAIDGIPALIIDPKGDMGNLMLSFPQLKPAEFRPWIEPDEAARQGMTLDEAAAAQANAWRNGLAEWGQSPQRIQKFRDAADVALYTPGSDAGLQLTILKSLNAPPSAIRESADAFRERVSSAVSGLLALLGVDADPLLSREHILLSNIVDAAWRQGRHLDLPSLIREIQNPPFDRVGVMDLESIFPAGDRLKLAMTVNNVLASPHFSAWTQGEPLDVQRLLYTAEGKPRLSILSIAHLNDRERMFFVTLLLNEVLTWMRSQPGTSSLRAILYMDEVFGYLPPTANPPSKMPMLTLLKQARAFGLGLVLATQNPVDLDYKALSNAGTWFLGRLQTERDKLRVLDGLEGVSTSSGVRFDRQRLEQILSAVDSRVFLLNNVHEDRPVLFHSRWALSYLRGPLTRDQIATLMASRKQVVESSAAPPLLAARSPGSSVAHSSPAASPAVALPPVLPPDVHQFFLPPDARTSDSEQWTYRASLLARARLHYVDSKSDVDVWLPVARRVAVAEQMMKDPWDDSEPIALSEQPLSCDPVPGIHFSELPAECSRARSYTSWGSSFKKFLYRAQCLTLSYCPELKQYSRPDETEGDFKARLQQQARERRDLQIARIRAKHADQVARLEDRIRRAQQRVDEEREQANSAKVSAVLSFGTSVLGALFGRKKLSAANVSRAATSMRSANRAAAQSSDVSRAEEDLNALQQALDELNRQLEREVEGMETSNSLESLTIEAYKIRPRKSDITAEDVALLWQPHRLASAN